MVGHLSSSISLTTSASLMTHSYSVQLSYDQPDVYSVLYPAVLRPTAIANSFLQRGSVIECKTHRDLEEQRE